MKHYKSASTERPPEWDTTSSPEVVYHNYNVVEVLATEEKPLLYEYEVDHYTRMEYLEMRNTENTEALEMILSGVTE